MSDDGCFAEREAAFYDRDHCVDAATLDASVAFLTALAGGAPVLEFAIGAGRVALPLARQGIEVHGIELSRAMVAKLREKEGGANIAVTIGDMAATQVSGQFGLVYLVFNTISNLTTQEAQVACLRNSAAHITIGGCFVVENAIPPLQRLPPGETRIAFERSDQSELAYGSLRWRGGI